MSAPNQRVLRETIRDLSQRQADHERRTGKLPKSREIEKKWQEIARRNDRKSQDDR